MFMIFSGRSTFIAIKNNAALGAIISQDIAKIKLDDIDIFSSFWPLDLMQQRATIQYKLRCRYRFRKHCFLEKHRTKSSFLGFTHERVLEKRGRHWCQFV